MSILEKLPSDRSVLSRLNPLTSRLIKMCRFIVDGMTEVKALEKSDWIKTCLDLADHFAMTIFDKYQNADEISLIFDRNSGTEN